MSRYNTQVLSNIQILCAEKRIPGVFRIGNTWAIPEEAEKPKDARVKSGKYIKTELDNALR